jgi:hypothetical protein
MTRHFFIKIFLFLFLASNTVAASHIHHDDPDHGQECEICLIVNNFHSADVPHSAVDISMIAYGFDETALQHDHVLKLTLKGYYSTAPPVSSFYF